MATALKLKNDINKLKAALRSKATPKSFIPKLKSQLDKAEADYESVKAGKKSAPKAGKQVKSTMDKLKAIIKKKKYGAYRAQGVDLKKDAYPKKILNQLYKLTPLQTSFHFNMLALVDGIQPRVLGLADILGEIGDHNSDTLDDDLRDFLSIGEGNYTALDDLLGGPDEPASGE